MSDEGPLPAGERAHLEEDRPAPARGYSARGTRRAERVSDGGGLYIKRSFGIRCERCHQRAVECNEV